MKAKVIAVEKFWKGTQECVAVTLEGVTIHDFKPGDYIVGKPIPEEWIEYYDDMRKALDREVAASAVQLEKPIKTKIEPR